MSSAAIKLYGGVPTLFIDGVPQIEMAYMTYFDKDAMIEEFYQAGYRIFCLCVYFGDQSINPANCYKPFAPGIFSKKGEADFSYLESIVANLLEKAPDAKIFFRVNTSMPKWWEDENPSELNDSGIEGQPPRSCVASRKYREQTKKMLREFIEHLEASAYCDRIFGLQLAGGRTDEWGSFDDKGNTGKASREEFLRRCPGKSLDSPDFRRFLHIIAGENLCELAKFTKETMKSQWIVGTFFGYLFEITNWHWGNHALQMLLESPDIDFLCSPCSYINRKKKGFTWPCMLPAASLCKHGKLYFFEYDTRTHLSRYMPDCHPDICQDDRYRIPVWLGPPTEEESIEHLRMNFVQQMAMGCASWWFDLMGKWYDSPGLMSEMSRLKKLAEPFMHDADRTSIAECAVYIDEEASAYIQETTAPAANGTEKAKPEANVPAPGSAMGFVVPLSDRAALGQIGIPLDYYEMHDFMETAKRYRCVFFFVTARTRTLEEAEAYCRMNDIPFMELDGSTPVATAAVREFCTSAGAHCYCDDMDAGVWCGRNIASVIALHDGKHTLRLPEQRRISPLFTEEPAVHTDTIEMTLKAGEVAAFRLD